MKANRKKRITVEFYRAEKGGALDEEIWSAMSKLPEKAGPSSFKSLGEYPHSVMWRELHDDRVEAEFCHTKLGHPATMVNMSGAIDQVVKSDQEGISENNAFVYYKKTGTLALERNRRGITAGKLLGYLKLSGFLAQDHLGEFLPYYNPTQMEQFDKLQLVKKFSFKVAGIRKFNELRRASAVNDGGSVTQYCDLAEEQEARDLEMTLSMGRSKGSLKKSAIDKIVQFLRRMQSNTPESVEHVKTIKVTGEDDYGDTCAIDFLNAFFHAIAEHKPSMAAKTQFRLKTEAIRTCYERSQSYFENYAQPPKTAD